MSTYNNMVSYYNTLPYSQKHSVGYPGGQPWQWPTNYHAPTNHQFITDNNSPPHHHQMYYNPHHMFHPAAAAASAADWHGTSDNFSSNVQNHHLLQQVGGGVSGVSANGGVGSSSGAGGGGGGGVGSVNVTAAVASSASATSVSPSAVTADLSMVAINNVAHHSQLTAGLPSPPITVSGSELSSPGAPASSSSPHNLRHHSINNSSGSINGNVSVNGNNTKCSRNNVNHSGNSSPNNNNNSINRRSPTKSPYYEWMKKPSYPAQPTPGSIGDDDLCTTASHSLQDFTTDLDESGKTRTKDKYRVVYSDYQRLELEKEYCTSRYITIRRKTELAGTLQLSERQVKIWFQNRRAKERKQTKKNSEQVHVQAQALTVQQVQEHVQAQHLHQHAQHVVQHQMQQQQQQQQHQQQHPHHHHHHHHHQQQQQQQHQQQQHVVQHPDLSSYMDTKPKIEPGLHHLQHPALHQMSSMAMSMAPMNLHHHLHHGHHPHSLAMAAAAHTSAAAVAAAAVHSHSHTLHHQTHHSQLSPTALAM